MGIFLVRHGQTNMNLERKLQGVLDEEENELNKKGIEQAIKTKELLKDKDIDLILCSPLKRAKQTAEIINQNYHVPIQYDNRIIERNFGEFEGISIFDVNTDELWSYNANKQYSKAENIKDFLGRVYPFIEEVKQKYKEKNILIVAHAGISMAFHAYYKGISENDNLLENRLKNCEYIEY